MNNSPQVLASRPHSTAVTRVSATRDLASHFPSWRDASLCAQSGLLVAISFPDHCDALALMNAVYAVAMDTATS